MNERLEKIKENWNGMSEKWNDFRNDKIIGGIIKDPYSIFRPQLQDMFKKFVGSLAGKRVLVPASGDNRAVFAFHLLGAKVTSSDLSEKQMECSARVAAKHGWDIEFVCDDVMHLSNAKSGEYDFVYISNGVIFWIDDLHSMYKSINRVLKSGGHHMCYEIHPFMHPFDIGNTTALTLKQDYANTGPFGKFETYAWRMQDILNAMIAADLRLVHMEEMNAEYGTVWVDWDKADTVPEEELAKFYDSKTNPLYALPQAVSLCMRKIESE